MSEHNTIKKRTPLTAAFLSLISMGLGQVYNGEPRKGVWLRVALAAVLVLYACRLFFDGAIDLAALGGTAATFLGLKIYSMVQAYRRARREGAGFTLRKYNRVWVYLLFTLVFIGLNVFLPRIISGRVASDFGASHHPFRSERAKARYLAAYDKQAETWPGPSETRMVETSWGTTLVRINGSADAPPLVLQHGIGGNSLQFTRNIASLAEHYRVYTIDNIYDYGRSVYKRFFRSPDDFVVWLDELFDGLGLESGINLMGLSYGGWLTSQYALKRPERLRKIIMAAPVMTVQPLPWGWIWRAVRATIPHRMYLWKFMVWMLPTMAEGTEADLRFLEEETDMAYLAARCFRPRPMVNPTLLTDEEWGRIRVPTLFLVGENERIYSAAAAVERLRRVAPQIETRVIPNAGHDLTFIQADLVEHAILAFLIGDAPR